jgi:hypothetical protein
MSALSVDQRLFQRFAHGEVDGLALVDIHHHAGAGIFCLTGLAFAGL